MITPTQVLKFIHLANQLILYPYIEYGDRGFIIHYANDSDKKITISDNYDNEEDRKLEHDYLVSEIESLTKVYESRQDQRQRALDNMSDLDKKSLGLI